MEMKTAVAYPKFRWFVAFASAWAWFCFGVIVISYSPMLPTLAKEFGQQIGTLVIVLMALNSVACAIGTMLSGPLVDRFGPRKVLLVSAILVLVYCLLTPFLSQTFAQLVILRLYQGLVIGPLFATMAALTQRWFPPQERGTVIGISKGVVAVGSSLAFLVVPALLQRFDGNWRLVVASSGVLIAIEVVVMAIVLLGKEHEMVRPAAGSFRPADDFRIATGLPVFWAGAVLLAIAQGFMQSVNGLVPSYLMAPAPLGIGIDPLTSGHLMTATQVGMIASGVLIGAIQCYLFRGSAKWLAATSFLASGLIIGALSLSFAHAQLSVFLFLTGALMNIGFPAVSVFITANYPPHILGKVFAISSGISVLGGALFSGLCGAILNAAHDYAVVFGFLIAVGVVGFLLCASMLNPIKAFRRAPAATSGKAEAAAGTALGLEAR